jgi:hypothetical protein
VESHKRDHGPLRRARHRLVARLPPLHGGGERRKLARPDETKQLLARHVGAPLVRHRGGGVSSGLEAQEVMALQIQSGKAKS